MQNLVNEMFDKLIFRWIKSQVDAKLGQQHIGSMKSWVAKKLGQWMLESMKSQVDEKLGQRNIGSMKFETVAFVKCQFTRAFGISESCPSTKWK